MTKTRIYLICLLLVTTAVSRASAQTATPGPCAFQIDCTYPSSMPFPTLAIPTSVVPTPTFLAPGSPLPPFPAIYPPGTVPAGGLKLVLNSQHILEFAWDLALYGVQLWNYYLHAMNEGTFGIYDGIQGIVLFILVLTLMNNIFTRAVVPRLNEAGQSIRASVRENVDYYLKPMEDYKPQKPSNDINKRPRV